MMRIPQLPQRASFVLLWVLAWLAASQAASLFGSLVAPSGILARHLLYFMLFAFLQLELVRRLLHLRLRGWLQLAALGAVGGQLAFFLLLHGMGAGAADEVYGRMVRTLPYDIVPAAMALWHIASIFLIWYAPAALQWLALRKRFRLHGLWLLATLSMALLSYRLEESALESLAQVFAGRDALLQSELLFTIALHATSAIAPAVMAAVLLVIVKGGPSKSTTSSP